MCIRDRHKGIPEEDSVQKTESGGPQQQRGGLFRNRDAAAATSFNEIVVHGEVQQSVAEAENGTAQ